MNHCPLIRLAVSRAAIAALILRRLASRMTIAQLRALLNAIRRL